MDIQTYLDQGKQYLAQGQGREAAIAYAHAAQIEPDNPVVHLGLAEANLALGSYGVVYMACRKVQELQPEGGIESTIAQALLDLLDRRYDRALQEVDTAISQDPGNGYLHAFRAYLLRINGQDYDASLARARATRLSYGGHYENCFPPVEPLYASGYRPSAAEPNSKVQPGGTSADSPRVERETVPTWSRPNPIQRQVVRTRFRLSQNPRFVTNIIIAINVIVYLLLAVASQNLGDVTNSNLFIALAQVNPIILQQGGYEYYRIFTAMFVHFSILHIGLNMLSLFFIGTAVEVFYGKWRYLVIYLVSGIVGGIATLLLQPNAIAAGASGAIFGVFGALGVFYIVNRNALGMYGRGAITNWIFWLGLNLVFGFSSPGIGIWDHIGGLVAGMVIGAILMPRLRRRRI
jgi:membrane associated rhomboid family serine protease